MARSAIPAAAGRGWADRELMRATGHGHRVGGGSVIPSCIPFPGSWHAARAHRVRRSLPRAGDLRECLRQMRTCGRPPSAADTSPPRTSPDVEASTPAFTARREAVPPRHRPAPQRRPRRHRCQDASIHLRRRPPATAVSREAPLPATANWNTADDSFSATSPGQLGLSMNGTTTTH